MIKGQVRNLSELEKLSRVLVSLLQPNFYLILQGELGAGKTTLVQFIAKNLNLKEKIPSPTFNILQRYRIRDDYYLNHFDFFRLNKHDNLDFFQELTFNNLNIIEWGENNPRFWQDSKFIISIKLIKEDNGKNRTVIIDIPFSLSSTQQNKITQFFGQLAT
jgi:tRNA threonylcarbamoyladenosine biosynthesis protein TsaE